MSLEAVDLSLLHDTNWQHRSERLARQISARLGQSPRVLPSPVWLAFERLSRPALVAAAAVLLLSLTSLRLLHRPPSTAPGSIMDLLAADQPPSAATIYLVMRGYAVAPSRRDEQP